MEQATAAQCVLYLPDDTTERFSAVEPALESWSAADRAHSLLWIDIFRPSAQQLDLLAQTFHLHPLAIEDVAEGGQRAKFERYGTSNFLVLRPASIVGAHTIEASEVDVFIGAGFLITVHRDGDASAAASATPAGDVTHDRRGRGWPFHHRHAGGQAGESPGAAADGDGLHAAGDYAGYDPDQIQRDRAKRRRGRRGFTWHSLDVFQDIHEEFSNSGARGLLGHAPRPARVSGQESEGSASSPHSLAAAYTLLHHIIDRIVDFYTPVLDDLEDEADDLEEQIFGGVPISSHDIYGLSRGILDLDRVSKPMPALMKALTNFAREVGLANELLRNLRDVADHVHSDADRLDRLRSILHEIFNVNSTLVAERQGDQTKKISAWAGIFFLPSLIAGIYGMNFTRMPELHWLLGYPFAIVMMGIGCVIMYLVFKRKDWV